jgi:hypothetical protein
MIETNKPASDATTNTRDGETPAGTAAVALDVPPLELQRPAAPGKADFYRLDELLCYHDRAFVTHVYASLARREPTKAELSRTLDDLRSGRRTKVDIVESLCTGGSAVRVAGLPSPALRRLSRLPIIGYVLRVLRGIARLPVLIENQQQFQTYALAQQQRITDYLNEVIVPAVSEHTGVTPGVDNAVTVADAVEGVMMLSDSLVEMAGQQSELQAQFQNLQVELQRLQAQREQSEAQLHVNVVALTETLTAQQLRLDELRRAQDEAAAGQLEFLVAEQRVIVEAQKVALGELQEQLRALAGEQDEKRAELAAEVCHLRVLVEALRAGADRQEREQA